MVVLYSIYKEKLDRIAEAMNKTDSKYDFIVQKGKKEKFELLMTLKELERRYEE